MKLRIPILIGGVSFLLYGMYMTYRYNIQMDEWRKIQNRITAEHNAKVKKYDDDVRLRNSTAGPGGPIFPGSAWGRRVEYKDMTDIQKAIYRDIGPEPYPENFHKNLDVWAEEYEVYLRALDKWWEERRKNTT